MYSFSLLSIRFTLDTKFLATKRCPQDAHAIVSLFFSSSPKELHNSTVILATSFSATATLVSSALHGVYRACGTYVGFWGSGPRSF
jgi:hypothetical protein